jgi:phosphoribosylformylglycinamidine (FGAM) synthase PurS component
LVSVLRLSPAIIVQDGQTLVEKNWKVTDLCRQDTEASTLPVSEEAKFVESYLTDTANNKISDYDIGDKINLVINTENMLDETITINLNDKEADFEYNGDRLINDTLSDYLINNNIETIELTVIEQQ